MIKFPCPHCGQKVSVSDEHGGQQAPCPTCGRIVTIPKPQQLSKMIRFFCSYCGRRVAVADEHGVRQALCPKCAKVATIPMPDDGASDLLAGNRILQVAIQSVLPSGHGACPESPHSPQGLSREEARRVATRGNQTIRNGILGIAGLAGLMVLLASAPGRLHAPALGKIMGMGALSGIVVAIVSIVRASRMKAAATRFAKCLMKRRQ
jgi:DNA-directed RNA polymerase subunit RPC12/RpoP